ncbi:hypothetical protein AVEN_126064-1, partial [Araneus ventricosus]
QLTTRPKRPFIHNI